MKKLLMAPNLNWLNFSVTIIFIFFVITFSAGWSDGYIVANYRGVDSICHQVKTPFQKYVISYKAGILIGCKLHKEYE